MPDKSDVQRIKGYTDKLHATSVPGRNMPKNTEAERFLPVFLKNATGRSKKMGQIRYRKKVGAAQWTCEVGGSALKL